MGIFIGEATMFYCPKCRSTYEDGTQRFCSNDGGRLLPALSASINQGEGKKGVFSTLLAKSSKASETKDDFASKAPEVLKVEKTIQPDFPPFKNGDIFKIRKSEKTLEFEPVDKPEPAKETRPLAEIKPFIETGQGAETKPVSEPNPRLKPIGEAKPVVETKPVARMIKPSEIASGTASVGDRSINPTGRLAISWEKPDALLGQIVKGRYYVTEKLGQDETGIAYLAEDKLSPEKKVIVRVLMEENAEDLESRIFAEERVSLSHLNHPHVAGLLDSGELLEGKPFIISEYVAAGTSVREKLQQTGQFNVLRAARIVRQAAYALSEVHQNGVLHRNLKPENIILTVNEAGTEQVKVTDFAVSNGKRLSGNPAYKSPEQLEGKLPTFASDIYSLAVIAYQMLTNRLPFASNSVNELIAAQKKGLNLKASNLRLDLPPQADEILEKALAYKPSSRFPKARDFGDALFNALATETARAEPVEAEKAQFEKSLENAPRLPQISPETSLDDIEIEIIDDDAEKADFVAETPFVEETIQAAEDVKESPKPATREASAATEDLPWEKRSPEPIKVASKNWMRLSVIGLIVLVGGLWAVWYYFLNQPNQAGLVGQNQTETRQISDAPVENAPVAVNDPTPIPPEIELPPSARRVLAPANTEFFQNTRDNLDAETVKYYRGFSFYYPKEWVKTSSPKTFADVSRKNENGIPIEQMVVTYYNSKGTFKSDRENFPALVKETNKKLSEMIPNYRFVSEGEKVINEGWKVYEMKFEGTIEVKKGETVRLFGRRLFMPAMRQGIKSGFIITMLATSLSPNVQSADDVGVRGELKTALDTFEPSPL